MRRRRSGDGESHLSLLMNSQLRVRRLLCLLKHHGLTAAAREVGKATRVFFDVDHMEHLLRLGHWDEADRYLQYFLPEHRSPQSTALNVHLRSACILAAVAGGGPDAAEHASTFDDQDLFQGPHTAKFRKVLHKMHADQPRASMLWQKIAPDAVSAAMRLVANCPELKGKLQLPRDRPMPWEVSPLTGTGIPKASQQQEVSTLCPRYIMFQDTGNIYAYQQMISPVSFFDERGYIRFRREMLIQEFPVMHQVMRR